MVAEPDFSILKVKPSLLQRILARVLPRKLFTEIAEASMQWVLICTECEHEHSIWSLGDVRWWAANSHRLEKKLQCRNCGYKGKGLLWKNAHPLK